MWERDVFYDFRLKHRLKNWKKNWRKASHTTQNLNLNLIILVYCNRKVMPVLLEPRSMLNKQGSLMQGMMSLVNTRTGTRGIMTYLGLPRIDLGLTMIFLEHHNHRMEDGSTNRDPVYLVLFVIWFQFTCHQWLHVDLSH